MSTYKYERYLSHVAQFPWAILPAKFLELVQLARFRATGARLSDDELQARFGVDAAAARPNSASSSHIAVVGVLGTMAYRADSFMESSGGASAQRIGRMIDRAVADDSVSAILLDVDSPGGSVEGITELAAKIVEARKAKPVWAHANALAASAAYWIASQADKLFVTPSGHVGSIGVFMLTHDLSEHLEKEGIKINAIFAGDNKLEGAFWEPLSQESRAHFQGQVDAVYADFVRAVAQGRGVSQAAVKERFGGGRVFNASEALKRGMVDGIATFEEVAAKLAASVQRRDRRATRAEDAAGLDLAAGSDEGQVDAVYADFVTDVVVVDTRTREQAEHVAETPEATAADGDVHVHQSDAVLQALESAEGRRTEPLAIEIGTDSATQAVADRDYADCGVRIAERR